MTLQNLFEKPSTNWGRKTRASDVQLVCIISPGMEVGTQKVDRCLDFIALFDNENCKRVCSRNCWLDTDFRHISHLSYSRSRSASP